MGRALALEMGKTTTKNNLAIGKLPTVFTYEFITNFTY
jgi:hypothetical protein